MHPTVNFSDSDLRGVTVVTSEYAVATADHCDERLNPSLSALLRRVRMTLDIDVALIAESMDDRWVMRHVDSTFPGLTMPAEPGPLAVASVFGTASLVSTPIVLRSGRTFGTLCCLKKPVSPEFSESYEHALRAIATLVAASVDERLADCDVPLDMPTAWEPEVAAAPGASRNPAATTHR